MVKTKNALPVALIPAYKPEPLVVELARALAQAECFQAVVVVNDGSPAEYEHIFAALAEVAQVTVLRHHVNLGKGSALKTGLNHIGCTFPGAIGTVTLDADGQHLVEDVLSVARQLTATPGSLVLGSRAFSRDVPLRSRFGNEVTRGVMRVFGGLRLRDTQTGLRGIPVAFFPVLLRLTTAGYDFELDMLLQAKAARLQVSEVPIQTVYIENNRTSHFDPLLDSLKIYLVFLRFNVSSLLAVVIDNSIFAAMHVMGWGVLASLVTARVFSGGTNYLINKQFVFRSERPHKVAVALYAGTVIVLGSCSYALIRLLETRLDVNVYVGKIIAETALYFASFALQREIVFAPALGRKPRKPRP